MTRERRNLYRILHVQPEAPAEVIKAAWRALMSTLRAHPDLGGDTETAARLNAAYEVLSDPVRRAAAEADDSDYLALWAGQGVAAWVHSDVAGAVRKSLWVNLLR
mgnify:CR=1 FL=1